MQLDFDNSRTRSFSYGSDALIARLAQDGLVYSSEVVRGLYAHVVNMQDLELDVPNASAHLLAQLELLVQAGVLESWIFCRLPEAVLVAGIAIRKKESTVNLNTEQTTLVRQISNNGYLGDSFELLDVVLTELRLFKKVVKRQLKDYFLTELGGRESPGRAFSEFECKLRDLNLPNYHHEVVKIAFVLALDYGREAAARWLPRLLRQCASQNLLEDSDVQHGLAIILGRLDDLKLDVPAVRAASVAFFSFCVSEELLSQ